MTSAIEKLQPSRLSDQLETLNTDVDLASLNLAVHGKASFQLLESVTAATIKRTIEGSSTLTITARDRDRALLRSGYIGKGLDTELDGLWFRLWAWSKNGDDLTLTFIDREVAVLKEWPPTSLGAKMYRNWPAAKFGTLTRFKFAEQLIRDVKDILPIRFVCPALDDPQNVLTQDTNTGGYGFPTKNDVTVKGVKADPKQLANLQAVLDAGVALKARRKVLIAAVAVVTQESTARTTATNGVHVGLFQQDPTQGWPATRNPTTDATAFFQAAISDDAKNPNLPIQQLADDVQLSGHPEFYAQWIDEATKTVDAYLGNTDTTLPPSALIPTNAPDPTRGQFIRGRLETPAAAAKKHRQGVVIVPTTEGNKQVIREDNWACLTRLAAEIGYRCFCVSGTVHFVDDYWLFHRKVAMELSEDDEGIDNIDADLTQGKLNATLTVACRADRWKAAPGSVAAVEDMGAASGRWLVTTTERSLFNPATTVTLQKPLEAIPESAAPEHGAGQSSGTQVYTPPSTPSSSVPPSKGGQYSAITLVQPVPAGFNTKLVQGVHETAGLAGYPAGDFGGDAGAPVVAVESGKIVRFSGHDPKEGPWDPVLGVHGPFGWSIYLLGDSGTEYYYTHLGSRLTAVGARVAGGQIIATIGDYAKWHGVNHTHVGVHPGSSGHPDINDLIAAPRATTRTK